MNAAALKGVIVPIITPLDAGEEVDAAGLRLLVDRLVAAGVHGIFVGGTTGEGPLLPMDQWRRLMEGAQEAVGGRVPLLGGVMDASSRRVCDKVRILRGLGWAHCVVSPTFFIPPSTDGEVLRLFGDVREAAGEMEIVAYHNPGATGAVLSVGALCELARRGWIRSCKDSSGDSDRIRELVKRGREAGLSVLAGDELCIQDALRAGADGIVPGCACVFPEVFVRVWQAAGRGDWAGVTAAFEGILRVRATLVAGGACWLSGIKYAASLSGIGNGRPMSPLEPANPEQQQRIAELLRTGV